MHKRKLTILILASFVFMFLAPVNYAAAEPIDDLVGEIEDLYSYADTDYLDFNRTSINAARAQLEELTAGQLDAIAGPLVTSKVTGKYAGTDLYDKDEWNRLITKLMAFTYLNNTDSNQLKADIENFRVEFSPHFKILFGEEITMDDLARLLQATRDQVRPVIGLSGAGILANDDNSTMIEKMTGYLYDALVAAVSQSDNVMFQGKFAELGWDKELLIQQAEILAADIDPAGDARRSLALIAIRSETDPIEDADLSVEDKPIYSVTIMGEDASDFVGWYSMDDSIVAVTPTDQGFDIEAMGAGTTELLAYRDYPESEPLIDWLVRFEVTVEGAGVAVDGTITSWNDIDDDALVKLYDQTYSDADIRTDMKDGTPANALENAATLGTPTYDSDSKRYNQSFSFADVEAGDYKVAVYKPGKYVVKVATISIGATNSDAGTLKLWLYGDVNDDGNINTTDGNAIYRYYAEQPSIFDSTVATDIYLAADVNDDGHINTTDGNAIYRYYAEQPSVFD